MFDFEEEIKEVTKLIKKYPHIKDFYLIRAKLYTKMWQYDKAIRDYETANNNFLCRAIISVCRKHNLVKEITNYYKKEIKENKNDFKNYISRAYFYRDIGQKSKALCDCKTALKLCPKNKIVIDIIEQLIKDLEKIK